MPRRKPTEVVLIEDPLGINRAGKVIVFQNGGELYLHHTINPDGELASSSRNILLDFASAYYPKELIEFVEKHGFLFNPYTVEPLPMGDGPYCEPSETMLRDLFRAWPGPKGKYPEDKRGKVTRGIEWVQRSYGRVQEDYQSNLEESMSEGRELHSLFGGGERNEALGDWIAASDVLHIAMKLLGEEGGEDRKARCPSFEIDLSHAPRYRSFLAKAAPPHCRNVSYINDDGTVREIRREGMFIDGKTNKKREVVSGHKLVYCPSGATTVEVVEELALMHIDQEVRKIRQAGEIVDAFDNLLQVIWYQWLDQVDRRLYIGMCENPLCGNYRLGTRGKKYCCKSCQESMERKGRNHG